MKNWLDERIDKVFSSVLVMWRKKIDRIVKRVYVGMCAGSLPVGRMRKRWTDIVKGC